MLNILKRRRRSRREHNHENQSVQHTTESEEASQLETYSFWVLLATLFLLPIIFLPSLNVPFQFTKTAIVFAGVLIALILFLVSRLKEGKLTLPYNLTLIALWVLPVVYFVSTVFSMSPRMSFIGNSFETDTFSYILLMALFVTLVVSVLKKKEQTLYAYMTLFAAFIFVWVFQGLRLFLGPDFLSFNVLTLSTSNILGKWNDMAIFFGLATILTLVTLASLQLSQLYKKILYLILVVSLFFLAVVNLNVVWVIVGLFSLGFFVHSISINPFNWKRATPESISEGEHAEKKLSTETRSLPALIVLIVAVVFVIGGNSLGGSISSYFNISQIEARPSWATTMDIGASTYVDNAFFGSGPNTFVKQWALYKPVEINSTIFWNADFVSGIGTIPTAFVTTGIVGAIAWILFLGFFIYGGVRALVLAPVDNRFSYYVSLSSFLAGLYLWVLTFFYTPNVVLVTLAFFFTAVFISSLRHYTVRYQEWTFSFANNPRTGFVSVLGLTMLLLISIVGIYSVGQQYIATIKFQEGVVALNLLGDIDAAEASISNAARINTSDRYHRLLADIGVGRLRNLQQQTDLSQDELRTQFQNLLANAIQNGQRATEIDPTNYQNWLALGRVYESVVPLGIEGAYDNAVSTYQRALELNPNGASIFLTLARLEVARGDTLGARDFIAKAIALKSDYTEAIFLLSQIDIAEGNLEGAIISVEAASVISPNNSVIFFQLGLLQYNQNNNEAAISAFGRAVALNEEYSNARYFLGLTYDRQGQTAEAISQFERVEELNQENEEVKFILANLRAGRAAFEGAGADVQPPETRGTLPLEEGISTDVIDEIPVEELPTGQ